MPVTPGRPSGPGPAGATLTQSEADTLYVSVDDLTPLPVLPTFRGCRVYGTTGVSNLVSTGFSVIPFDTEVFDATGFHSTVTNNHRFTVPTGYGGYYEITGAADFGVSNTSRQFALAVYKNGTAASNGTRLALSTSPGHANIALRLQVTTGPVALSAGDWVHLAGYMNSASDGGTDGAITAGQDVTWFAITQVAL